MKVGNPSNVLDCCGRIFASENPVCRRRPLTIFAEQDFGRLTQHTHTSYKSCFQNLLDSGNQRRDGWFRSRRHSKRDPMRVSRWSLATASVPGRKILKSRQIGRSRRTTAQRRTSYQEADDRQCPRPPRLVTALTVLRKQTEKKKKNNNLTTKKRKNRINREKKPYVYVYMYTKRNRRHNRS